MKMKGNMCQNIGHISWAHRSSILFVRFHQQQTAWNPPNWTIGRRFLNWMAGSLDFVGREKVSPKKPTPAFCEHNSAYDWEEICECVQVNEATEHWFALNRSGWHWMSEEPVVSPSPLFKVFFPIHWNHLYGRVFYIHECSGLPKIDVFRLEYQTMDTYRFWNARSYRIFS